MKKLITVGFRRGHPRLYLSGSWLVDAGFIVGVTFVVVTSGRSVRLHALHGTPPEAAVFRRVGRHGKDDMPFIDINDEILDELGTGPARLNVSAGKLVITMTPKANRPAVDGFVRRIWKEARERRLTQKAAHRQDD